MRTRVICFALALSVATLGWGTAAEALGLLGKTLDGGYYTPDTSTLYALAVFSSPTFVVGAGQETSVDVEGSTTLLVDFDNSTLTIAMQTSLSSPTWNSASFNGLIFDSAVPLDIASATVDGTTTMVGFDNSRVSFNANQILLNWQGLGYTDGTVVKINFTFVPEPGTGLLAGLGLFGLGLYRRRARRSAR